MKKIIILAALFNTVIFITPNAMAVVQGTPHDLSAIGGGNTCSFCHTPHGSLSGTPLWNHTLSTATYKIYQSSSLDAKVGQPTGSSKLCLSCHDGTIALTETVTGQVGGSTYISPGAANLGTDLSDDHPISFVYSSTLTAEDKQIHSPSSLPQELRLSTAMELQCTTCHDPHNNEYGDFLVMSNFRSAMCTSCHNLRGWVNSSHEKSPAIVTASTDKYFEGLEYKTVADNGCNSCHRPHSAGGHERLLHFEMSEDNCLSCHDGTVATTNIASDISKMSRHDVKKYHGDHDPVEIITQATAHIECVDCHNPHATQSESTEAPIIPGAMKGVSGITAGGSVIERAQYGYEVCFKCHSTNAVIRDSFIQRQITQVNTRYEFAESSISFHPVVTQGQNQDVPSLRTQFTEASMIFCTDCHSSDGLSSAKGPHGSIYSPLLKYRYETDDYTSESASAYELCYSCHSRNSILNDESFDKHEKHLKEQIPCSACHDPHGIDATQGTPSNNSHLINFDTTIVAPNSRGVLEFVDNGRFSGQCSLDCHGEDHDDEDYN